jgi:hypothetical protein
VPKISLNRHANSPVIKDPRVDSDNDHSRTLGATNGTSATGGYSGASSGNHALKHTGDQGGISNSTNAGPGNQPEASKGGVLGASGKHATQGSGIAQNTAGLFPHFFGIGNSLTNRLLGPHNSDTLNKLEFVFSCQVLHFPSPCIRPL